MKNILLSLFEIFIYSSALILAVFAIKNVTQKKISAKFVHLLWLVVLVRLIMPVTLDSPIHVNIPQPAAIVAPKAVPPIYDTSSGNITASILENSLSSPNSDIAAKSNVLPTALPTVDLYLIALLTWAAGAFIFMTVSFVRIVSFKRKLKQLYMTDDYKAQLEAAKKEIDIKQEIRIALSEHTDIPFVYGAIKPVIVIPKHFKGTMPDTKLSYIILHELCHVKRYDILINFVWLFARAIHWFNPLAHIAYKSYLDSADRACDEMVSHNMHYDEKCEYSQSLIDVMRHAQRSYNPSLALSLCRNKSTLSKRIENILHPKKKSKTALIAMIIAVGMIVLACFTTACKPKEAAISDDNAPTDTVEASGPTPTPIFRQYFHRGEPKQMTVDEGLKAIENLGLTPNATFSYEGYNEYFGDEDAIYKYYPNSESKGIVYTILSSDKSLASYYNSDCDMSFETNLSSDELTFIAVNYIKSLWNTQDVEVNQFDDSMGGIISVVSGSFNKKNLVSKSSVAYDYSYFYNISGVIKEINRPFNITLNGKGELHSIYCYPTDVDFEKGCTLDKAKEIAIKLLKEEVHINDINNLTLVSETLDSTYMLTYILNYQYRSKTPSYYDFDYDCEIRIGAADGERMIVSTTPITENIDVYQIDEAEQMAKEYIAQEKYGSSDMWDRFTTMHKYTGVDNYTDPPDIPSTTFLRPICSSLFVRPAT